MSVFRAASFPAVWLSRKHSDGNMIIPMHISQPHHYVGSYAYRPQSAAGFIGSRLGSFGSNADQEEVDGSLSIPLLDLWIGRDAVDDQMFAVPKHKIEEHVGREF